MNRTHSIPQRHQVNRFHRTLQPTLANHQHLTPITQHPSLAVTFCEICMPEAVCEFETLVEMFC